MALKTSIVNSVIEVDSYSNEQKFLLNLLPQSISSDLIESGCSEVVEQAGLNWCPFCGINLEEETK